MTLFELWLAAMPVVFVAVCVWVVVERWRCRIPGDEWWFLRWVEHPQHRARQAAHVEQVQQRQNVTAVPSPAALPSQAPTQKDPRAYGATLIARAAIEGARKGHQEGRRLRASAPPPKPSVPVELRPGTVLRQAPIRWPRDGVGMPPPIHPQATPAVGADMDQKLAEAKAEGRELGYDERRADEAEIVAEAVDQARDDAHREGRELGRIETYPVGFMDGYVSHAAEQLGPLYEEPTISEQPIGKPDPIRPAGDLAEDVRYAMQQFSEPTCDLHYLFGHKPADVRDALRLTGPSFEVFYDIEFEAVVISRKPSMTQELSPGLPTVDGWIYVDPTALPEWLTEAGALEPPEWEIVYDIDMMSATRVGVRCVPLF